MKLKAQVAAIEKALAKLAPKSVPVIVLRSFCRHPDHILIGYRHGRDKELWPLDSTQWPPRAGAVVVEEACACPPPHVTWRRAIADLPPL